MNRTDILSRNEQHQDHKAAQEYRYNALPSSYVTKIS
jgi:hypothetical protein